MRDQEEDATPNPMQPAPVNSSPKIERPLDTPGFGLRRWYFLTIGLYALTILLLFIPLVWSTIVTVGEEWESLQAISTLPENFFQGDSEFLYIFGGYFCGLIILIALFLLMPIKVARHRPVHKRSWVTLAMTSGFMMGLLVVGISASMMEAVWVSLWEFEYNPIFWPLIIGFIIWIIWAVIFFSYRKSLDPTSAIQRTVDRLVSGSLLELLIAVPCHIYVRQKDYCCAGFFTFWGLATGLAVLFFAFGPGILFLFAARVQKLRRARAKPESNKLPRILPFSDEPFEKHTKDGILWLMISLLFVLTFPMMAWFNPSAWKHLFIFGASSASVTCGMACLKFTQGWLAKESRKWILLLSFVVLEIILGGIYVIISNYYFD